MDLVAIPDEERRENRRQATARWRKRNPDYQQPKPDAEAERDRARRYRTANPNANKEATLRYRKNNPQAAQNSSRKYYNANRETELSRTRAWFGTPEGRAYKCAHEARRRAKIQTKDPRVKAVYKIAAWLRDLGDDVHVDHILPLSRGGTHTYGNLQILEASANRKKSARSPTPEELKRCRLLQVTKNWI